jgi:hypothetical protein
MLTVGHRGITSKYSFLFRHSSEIINPIISQNAEAANLNK